MGDVYTHGHHEAVLRGHRWRTAANSAGYLLRHLRPGLDLLDVGCGPGTITVDLAARVAPGRVLGIDTSAEVVGHARDLDASGVEFAVGNVYALEVEDASFDGLLAVRDSDYGAFFWAPANPQLDRWLALYHELTVRNRVDADAGRRLPAWIRAGGFEDLTVTYSNWTFADPAGRAWWGGQWADRVRHSSYADQALAYGLTNEAELAAIEAGWREWIEEPDGVFVVPSVEVLARR